MPEYRYPGQPAMYEPLLDAVVMAAWEKKFNDAEAANQQLYRQKLADHKKLVEDAIQLYGQRNKVVHYLQENVPAAPTSLTKVLQGIRTNVARQQKRQENSAKRQESKLRRQQEAEREAAAKREANKRKRERHQARLIEVTEQLTGAGYVLDEDFARRNAIKFMKEHSEWVLDEDTGRHKRVLNPKTPMPSRETLAFESPHLV